jgi:predicted membrane-bound spermidine synthase
VLPFCVFFSPVSAGLIYEIAWIRQAALVFGSTIFAVSTVLAVFFLGLALGSYLFAGISHRSSRPLRLYALLEIALGIFAVISLYAFDLAVLRKDGILRLEIDRLWQGHSEKSHQIMAAHIPMVLHPDPQQILVVGVGTGQTPARFLMHDPQRLDCVDIEPAIFEFIHRHFDNHWMDDARVSLIREDGLNYIAHSAARYDIISLELGQIFRPGVPYFIPPIFMHRPESGCCRVVSWCSSYRCRFLARISFAV